MKREPNKTTLIKCDDSMLYLATVIVYSGVVAKDVAFFRSAWAKTVFDGLGIEADPLDWYYMILDRKERKKYGSRRS